MKLYLLAVSLLISTFSSLGAEPMTWKDKDGMLHEYTSPTYTSVTYNHPTPEYMARQRIARLLGMFYQGEGYYTDCPPDTIFEKGQCRFLTGTIGLDDEYWWLMNRISLPVVKFQTPPGSAIRNSKDPFDPPPAPPTK